MSIWDYFTQRPASAKAPQSVFEALGLGAPQASSTAQPIGQDELGRTIYRDSTGATYAMGSQPVQRTDAQRNDQMLIDAGIFPPDPADPRAAVNALATGLMSGFTTPGNALRGQPVTLGDVWETAGTAALGANAMPAPENALRAFNVYHGSPHDFDRFSMDKIGTGEGAQAYGHGLYFADNEGVARNYRNNLSGQAQGTPYVADEVRGWVESTGGDYAKAAQEAKAFLRENGDQMDREQIAELKNAIYLMDQGKESFGRMYEVQIDANPNDFLDWDAPLSEQPKVLERLGFSSMDEDAIHAEALRIMEAKPNGAWMADPASKARVDELQAMLDRKAPQGTGQDFYRGGSTDDVSGILSQMGYGNPAEQSQALRQAGVPGIRYLDAGSRGAGDGSRNYVVFDENLISIVRKYGIAGAAALYGATSADVQAAMAQEKQPTGLLGR